MTGFGRAEGVLHGRKVVAEVRSLNSKQLDLTLKLPPFYRDRDAGLRLWANEQLVRGKAELVLSAESTAGTAGSLVDPELVRKRLDALKALQQAVDPAGTTDLLGFVLRMPDVMGTPISPAGDAEWSEVLGLVRQAMDAFMAFRASEGAKLAEDLNGRVTTILELLQEVEGLDDGRGNRTRQRLMARLEELNTVVDKDRFEQELVFYLEKMDINEEKVRLRTHCAYFTETLEGPAQQGRKLGFIAQEMGREINTLGSKSNDATMQRKVVMMKDELEKIKEQVLNVL